MFYQAFSKEWVPKKLIFLFLNQNICVGTQKNRLNEMVLLSTQNIRLNWWVRKYYNFMLKDFVYLNLCLWRTLDGLFYDVVYLYLQSEELRRTLADKKPDSGAVIHSLKQKILKLETQMRDKESNYM